ncbi:MAG: flotillin-like FloA family protein, partial [Bacteroidaceae bacterium]|nr:flotillin-like FloA family protein [Bacteroidaceae bacterium]
LRDGNMGFMDYYKLENLKGDTAMRDNIAKLTKEDLGGLIK